jgi:autotransporter adhesin
VQYSNALTPTTPNGGTPTQDLTLVGAAAGPVTLNNVAAGALTPTSNQAVNGSQINSLGTSIANNLGGGSTFNTTTGAVTNPTYTVDGNTYNTVGSAITAAQSHDYSVLSSTPTADTNYNNAGATGSNSLAAGVNASSAGAGSTAVGYGASALGGGDVALGQNASSTVADGVALGNGATVSNAGAVALGSGSVTAAAVGTASTTINGTAYAFAGTTPSSTVSVGSAGSERTITNVAAGRITAGSTDAINGSELFATNQAVTSLANGGAGPVQYSNALTPTTPNGGTPTQDLTLVGAAAGPVTLNNVAAGALTPTSNQAVNGSQINTLGASIANNLGGGSVFDTATGGVTNPTYNVYGTTQTTVGGAITALQNDGPVQYTNTSTGTTGNGGTPTNYLTLIGGGVGPVTLNNVAAGAINATSTQAVNGSQLYATNQAINAVAVTASEGWNVTTAATGTGTVSGTSVQNIAPGATTTFTAGNNVAITQNGANIEIATSMTPSFNSVTTNTLTTSGLTVTPGATINMGGNVVSNVAAGVAGTDAVNVSQLGAATAAVATHYYSVNDNGTQQANYTNGGATGANSLAAGVAASAAGVQATALGNGATAGLANSVALGSGSIATGASSIAGNAALGVSNNAGAVAAGSGNVVSVGAAGAERQIQNVAAGALTATSTDAVNGSQVYSVQKNVNSVGNSVATNFGGGATYNSSTGVISNPTYNVYGTTQTDVGGAVAALQNNGPVQYTNTSTGTTGNGGTPTNYVTLVGSGASAGPVTLNNVAPGAINAASTQAVNGSQLFRTASSVASSLGGGAAVNSSGQVTAPSYAVAGGTYNNVGSALGALNNVDVNLQNQINTNYQRANAGTSVALASSALRYDDRPGKWSVAAGAGTYHDQAGFAGGLGGTSEDGRWRYNASISFSPTISKPDVGTNAGLSYSFN